MRLIKHLNEQTNFSDLELNLLLETIHKECKPWVKEIGKFNISRISNPVMRGTDDSIRVFRVKKGSRRIDRKPKYTQQEVFEIFDKAFAEKFGWWVRSKGVFAGSEHIAYSYGKTRVFFPMGQYKYVWSAKYTKVWHNLTHPNNWEYMSPTEKEKHLINTKIDAEDAVKHYHSRNIRGAMMNDIGFEAIFQCKKYLLINYKAYIEVSNRI